MTNRVKGEVPLNLADGRAFVLVRNMRAAVLAEGLYGKPAPELQADVAAGFLGAIHAMFHGMLLVRHPGVSVSEVDDLLEHHSEEVTAAMEAAAQAAQAPETDRASDEVGNAPAGRRAGKISGRNGARRG